MGGKNLFLKTSTLQYHSRALYKIQMSASTGISNTGQGTSLSNYMCLWTRLWEKGRKVLNIEHLSNLRQTANWCPIGASGANETTGAQKTAEEISSLHIQLSKRRPDALLLYFSSGWPQSRSPVLTSVSPIFVLSSLLSSTPIRTQWSP